MTGGNGEEGPKEVIGVRRGMFGINGSGDTSGYGRLVREVALPGSTPRPYGGYFDEVVDRLAEVLGAEAFEAAVERVVVFRDQLTLEIRREHLLAVAQVLRTTRRCASSCAAESPACTTPRTSAGSCTGTTR